jgi:glycosyltransferase involved in cell wall biosynthesis
LQTRRDFEVVVVDLSEEGIAEMLAPLALRLPRLCHLRPGRRLSRPAALDAGIAAAGAPNISILDDDNLYDSEHLQRLVSGLESTGADYVYTGVRLATYADGQRLTIREVSVPFRFDWLVLGNFIYATGSAFRKALWEQIGGYDYRFEVLEDWDFLIRAAQAGIVAHLPVISGESRKFTGRAGVSNYDLEVKTSRRCHAGLFWTHRRHYRGRLAELRRVTGEYCQNRFAARTGLQAISIAGWRVELVRDLFSWWCHNLRFIPGGSRLEDSSPDGFSHSASHRYRTPEP